MDDAGNDPSVVPGSIADIPRTAIADIAPPANPFAGLPWPPPEWGMPAPMMAPPPPPLQVGPTDMGMGPLNELAAPPGAPPPPPPPPPAPGQTIADVLGAPGIDQPNVPSLPGVVPEGAGATAAMAGAGEGAGAAPVQPGAPPPNERAQLLAKWAHDPLNPQAGLDLTQEERGQIYAGMDPVERAGYEAKRASIQQQESLGKQHQVALEYAQQQRQDWEDYTKAHAAATAAHDAAVADAMKLAQQKMDPDHWRNSRSTFQSIAGALSVITGGLAQGAGFKGGNPGLEMINKAIDRDMEAQRDNLANQRSVMQMRLTSTGEQMQQASRDYQMLATHNIALHETAIQAMQSEAQQYDPAGTTAQNIGAAIANQRAAQQQVAKKLYDDTLKQHLEIAKEDREKAAQLETARHNKSQEGIEGYKASLEGKTKAAELTVHPPEWYAAHYGPGEAPATPMTEKQYATYQETKGKIAERGTKAEEREQKLDARTGYGPPVTSKDLKTGALVKQAQPLIGGNNKVWHFATPEAAAEFQKKQDAVHAVVKSADHLMALRDEFDKTDYSDAVKSAKWQEAQSEFSHLVSKVMGVEGFNRFTEEDKNQMQDFAGALKDPTRFNGIKPGLANMRNVVIRDLNQELEDKGYDGRPLDFPSTATPPPPQMTELQKAHDLANSRKITPELLEQNGYAVQGGGGGALGGDAATQIQIAQLGKIQHAMVNPATAKEAEDLLAHTAKDGPTEAVRAAAKEMLREAKEPGFGKPGTKADLEELAKHPPQINPNPYGSP